MHFLNLKDLSKGQITELIQKAKKLKEENQYSEKLKGKFLGLIFEKASTRTRISFEVAMAQLGGIASFFPINDLQLGRGEPLEDTARVISSMTNAIVLRTLEHETIERFSAFSSVPVINGLSDLSHPCQILADLLTFDENNGEIKGRKVAWIGDFNNACYSYAEASKLLGFELHVASPKKFWPSDKVPSKAPTSTVSPSLAIISFNTPETGEGTSRVTFSVSSSTIGSSAFILSPDDFIHFATVASTTDSPKAGTNNSIVISK